MTEWIAASEKAFARAESDPKKYGLSAMAASDETKGVGGNCTLYGCWLAYVKSVNAKFAANEAAAAGGGGETGAASAAGSGGK